MLDIKTLEGWLWEAACKIRGEIDAPKYKDYILPLIFLKRLSDVFFDEVEKLSEDYNDLEIAKEYVEEDHSLVWFYIPEVARWNTIRNLKGKHGEKITDAVRAIARENPKLQGVIDLKDFNETTAGQRIISDDKLDILIEILSKHRLGLKDVEPDILGRAYEYLLRKFAEGGGQSAGEFYTPKEVAILMAKLIDPQKGEHIYDPCLGSGGLLIKSFLRFKEKYKDNPKINPLQFFGQEYLHGTYAMARMNMFIHRMDAEVALGDTMNRPAFLNENGSLKEHDVILANPMWNQNFPQDTYENDSYNRFTFGFPPSSTSDWGWVQHMYKSLNKKGRMAVVLDTGSVSRGSGNQGSNRERDIRKSFIDKDRIECVILLPTNLFYNTPAPGIILILNNKKKHENEILLINASKLFEKGKPKNYIPDSSIKNIEDIYHKWIEQEGVSTKVSKEELLKNDYNLSPSRYISVNGNDETLPLEDAFVLLKEAQEEQIEADTKLKTVFEQLGLE